MGVAPRAPIDTIAITVLLFLISIRRAGERAGRMAERIEGMEKASRVVWSMRGIRPDPVQSCRRRSLTLSRIVRIC